MLSVYNPNGYRLDATRLTYNVLRGDDSVTLATGALDRPVHGAGRATRRS